MERKTFSVIFYVRKTRTNRKGEAPILMRITVDGMRTDTTVKKSIDPKSWDSVAGKAAGNSKSSQEINLYLDSIRFRITRIRREMELDGTE